VGQRISGRDKTIPRDNASQYPIKSYHFEYYLRVIDQIEVAVVECCEEIDNNIDSKQAIHSYVKPIAVIIIGFGEGHAIRRDEAIHDD
jgi:hypothetical protein